MAEPTNQSGGSGQTAARIAFYAYFVASFLLLAYMVKPFLTTLLVAAVLAVWLRPVYVRLVARWPHPRLLAALLTMGVVVLLLGPLSWAATKTIMQVGAVAEDVSALIRHPEKLGFLDPVLRQVETLTGVRVEEIPKQLQSYVGKGAGSLVQAVGRGATEVLGTAANLSLNLIILLFSLFTFMTYADVILRRFKRISPLKDSLEDELIQIFQGFSRGIVLGGFLTALIQGIVAGIGYAIFGISEAFFWGVMTGLFSFVPFVGTAMIWVPMCGLLFFQGDASSALFLALYSALITGSVDNLVRPWMIGQNSTLNPMLLFLTIFGGLLTLGPPGVLIGPVTASFFLALAEVYETSVEFAGVPSLDPTGEQGPEPPPDGSGTAGGEGGSEHRAGE